MSSRTDRSTGSASPESFLHDGEVGAVVSSTVAVKFRDWGLLLLCNFIWASQFALVKLVQGEAGPMFTTAFPMALATLLLVPIVVWETRRSNHPLRDRLRGSDLVGLAILGVAGQVVAQLFATWGTQRSLASNAALISLSLPVATALIAFVLLGERMSWYRWVGFALALAGVLVCSVEDLRGANLVGRGYLMGNFMVFLGVLGSAFYNVYSKKLLTRFTPLELLLGSYVAAGLLLVPLTLVVEPEAVSQFSRLSARAWSGLLLLAAFQYCVAMVIFLTVLTRLDATQAAVSNYLIPAFGVMIAWMLLSERLQPAVLAGGVLVLAGTLTATVWEERARQRRAGP